MNKPVILLGLTGLQLMIIGSAIAISFIINVRLGLVVFLPIAFVLRKVIIENKKGNYKFLKSKMRYKNKNLKDKTSYLKYIED